MLGKPPVEERTHLIRVDDLQRGEFVRHDKWAVGGRDDAVFGVCVEKDLDFIATLQALGDVARWQENLAEITALKEHAVVMSFNDLKSADATESWIVHGKALSLVDAFIAG